MSEDQIVRALHDITAEVRGMRADISSLLERIAVVEITVKERKMWCDEHGRIIAEHDMRLDTLESGVSNRKGWMAGAVAIGVAAVEVLRWIFDYFRGGGGR
jgi:hypothetical protein